VVGLGFDFYPMLLRLHLLAHFGDFGNRLFEPIDFIGEFPIAAKVCE